jgi:hypothetical protein
VAATAAERRAVQRDFASRASQQLVWEAASNLKARHLPRFARVAFAGARMYPVGVGKKILAFLTSKLRTETVERS